MGKRTTLLLVAVLAVILAGLAYLAAPRIAIGLIARSHGLDIRYNSARFIPHIAARGIRGLSVDIDMKDMVIKRTGAVAGVYRDLSSLMSAPFDGSLRYRETKGVIRPAAGKILIDNLDADAGAMKISARGTYSYSDGKVDLDIVMRFSPDLLKEIPPELCKTALTPEPDGWSTLSVSLKGDFNSPAVQITSKLFRLNIREVSAD